jgi:nucleoside-diphosphate-sugar epimerase
MKTSTPILVTGATGYVAGWIIKRLLEEGNTVHAAVRDPNNKQKIAHLDKIASETGGTIKYFKADLLVPGSFSEAMHGCEIIMHTASPFTSNFKNAQAELIDPAVKGTINVLEEANKTHSVQKIVLTSSCAAIYTDAVECAKGPNGMLTEDMWNTTASLNYQPYSYSKLLAEKKAWEIHANQGRWTLVTINPSLVLGPALNPEVITSESYAILKQIGDGTLKIGAPKLGIGMVDVRDVAEAHLLAAFKPHAKGRYITSAHNTDLLELSMALLPKYGDRYPIPKQKLPKWLLLLVGPFVNKAFSRKFIKNNVDIAWKADNSKIRKELELQFRPLQTTMEDAFEVIVDHKLLK